MENFLALNDTDEAPTQDNFGSALRFVENVDYDLVAGGTAVNCY